MGSGAATALAASVRGSPRCSSSSQKLRVRPRARKLRLAVGLVPCPTPDLGERLREAGLLKARLCRWAAKPRSTEEVRISEPRRRSTGRSRCNLATGGPGLCGRPLHTASRQLGRPARTDPSARSTGRRGRPGGLGVPIPSILRSVKYGTAFQCRCPSACDPAIPIPHGWRWRLGAHRERGSYF